MSAAQDGKTVAGAADDLGDDDFGVAVDFDTGEPIDTPHNRRIGAYKTNNMEPPSGQLDDEHGAALRNIIDAVERVQAGDSTPAQLSAALARAASQLKDPNAAKQEATEVAALRTQFSRDALNALPAHAPHLLYDPIHNRGLWPIGKVSVVGGAPRDGKTVATSGIGFAALVRGEVQGLKLSDPDARIAVFGAEDDAETYGARLRALARHYESQGEDCSDALARIFISDFQQARDLRTIIEADEYHNLRRTRAVDRIIKAYQGRNVRALIIDTTNRVLGAEETNLPLRALVDAGEDIAIALGCAVVLVHHVSQAGTGGLATLELSEAMFRGGTALPSNARQTALVVNLGSHNEPVGSDDKDLRDRLREAAFPKAAGNVRYVMYATLSTSAAANPLPMFLQWCPDQDGWPAAVPVNSNNPVVADQTLGMVRRTVQRSAAGTGKHRGGRDED